ncbi:hypothetical protein AHF37_04444, partial [Paragonimus kellicotti]
MEVHSDEVVRSKRKTRGGGGGDDDDKWECSVCTYINPSESYKCEMCFMRKGTSTRKPRLNPQVVEQQQLIAQAILKEKDDDSRKKKTERVGEKIGPTGIAHRSIKLKNFDRSSPLLFEIFANGYSVVITEFQLKSKIKLAQFPDSPAASNCSSLQGFPGILCANPEQLSPTDSTSTLDTVHRHPNFAEFDFADAMEPKPRVYSHPTVRPVNNHRPASNGLLSSNNESACPVPVLRSYSSASSSIGGTNLSRCGSPNPAVLDSCLAEVKREQAALEAEQAARDGDDEGDNDEETKPHVNVRPVGAHPRRTSTLKLSRSNHSRTSTRLKDTETTPEPTNNLQISSTEAHSERLSSVHDVSLLTSSSRLRQRHLPPDAPNPYVSPPVNIKRKKLCPTRSGMKLNLSERHFHSSSKTPDGPPPPATDNFWPNRNRSRCTKRRSLRVPVNRFHMTAKISGSPTVAEPKPFTGKRSHSSTRSSLKCKIRVIRSESDPTITETTRSDTGGSVSCVTVSQSTAVSVQSTSREPDNLLEIETVPNI